MSDTDFSIQNIFEYFMHESGHVNVEITEQQFYYLRLAFYYGFRASMILDSQLAKHDYTDEEFEEILNKMFDEAETVIAENEKYQLDIVPH